MALNYTQRLQNLQQRKYDPEIRKAILSESFGRKVLPENVEYLLEATRPIDNKYNEKTIEASTRVRNHLEEGFRLHFSRAYRTQGSVRTKTNIRTYSDIDLLTIIDRYFFVGPGVPNDNPYTESDHDDDICEMRKQAIKILKDIYDEVDDTGSKCISIKNKSLNRKVDVVFSFWYNTKQYIDNQSAEYYRGVYLYDFIKKQREVDYPFATISLVNSKGDSTYDGSRKGIRLIKNLRSDNDQIDLSSFKLTSIVHSINNRDLLYTGPGSEINIAQSISDQLARLIEEKEYRINIESPNGIEKPLKDDTCVSEMKKLKKDLDELIIDCASEIKNSMVIKREITSY